MESASIIDDKKAQAKAITEKYDLSLENLRQLFKDGQNMKVIILCDDTKSMNETIGNKQKFTKWSHAKSIIEAMIDLSGLFAIEFEIKFFNRQCIKNVTKETSLESYFQVAPDNENVEITQLIANIINDNREFIESENNFNIILITNNSPSFKIKEPAQALVELNTELDKHESFKNLFLTICLYNHDKQLNKCYMEWSKTLKNVVVVEDYLRIKENLEKMHKNISFGDYLSRIILSKTFDDLKEFNNDDDNDDQCFAPSRTWGCCTS